MNSLMDDSFDEALANMEMPEDPGPSANIKATSDKPDEKHTKISSAASSNDKNNATKAAASIVSATTTTKNSPNAIQVNPNQRGNPLLKAITSIPWEFNNEIIADYVVGMHGD